MTSPEYRPPALATVAAIPHRHAGHSRCLAAAAWVTATTQE
jgi:hypothetical protein